MLQSPGKGGDPSSGAQHQSGVVGMLPGEGRASVRLADTELSSRSAPDGTGSLPFPWSCVAARSGRAGRELTLTAEASSFRSAWAESRPAG